MHVEGEEALPYHGCNSLFIRLLIHSLNIFWSHFPEPDIRLTIGGGDNDKYESDTGPVLNEHTGVVHMSHIKRVTRTCAGLWDATVRNVMMAQC